MRAGGATSVCRGLDFQPGPGGAEEITAYQRILGALAETALGEGESEELIATLAPSPTRIERIVMTAPEPDGIVWHKSSYSAGNGGCVEVGWRTGSDENGVATDWVVVRDSKDRIGPVLTFSAAAWRAFLATLTPLTTQPRRRSSPSPLGAQTHCLTGLPTGKGRQIPRRRLRPRRAGAAR